MQNTYRHGRSRARRAHHLLCMLTFAGDGYTPEFVANFAAIVARIGAGEAVELVDGPDDVCAPLDGPDDIHCDDPSVAPARPRCAARARRRRSAALRRAPAHARSRGDRGSCARTSRRARSARHAPVASGRNCAPASPPQATPSRGYKRLFMSIDRNAIRSAGFRASIRFPTRTLLDPYAMHAELRDLGAVVRLEKYGVWAMARHADVYAMLNDWETYCSSAGVGMGNFHTEKPWRPPSLILEADPPMHTQDARGAFARALELGAAPDARDVRGCAPPSSWTNADRARQLRCDARSAPRRFRSRSSPTPSAWSKDGRENLHVYGNAVFNADGPPKRALHPAMADAARVGPWISQQCRRDALEPGGLGADVYASVDSGEVTAAEAALLVRSLLSAGLDTTVHGIGNAMYCFINHPRSVGAAACQSGARARRFRRSAALRIAGPGVLPDDDARGRPSTA